MPTFTDQGSNTLRVGAGTVLLRATDSVIVNLVKYTVAQQDVTIPADTTRYVGCQYNSGSPNYVVKSADTWNGNTEYRIANVYNEGGTLHIFQRTQRMGNFPYWTTRYLQEVYGLQRAETVGGLILGESADANRYVTLSAGTLYDALLEIDITALDTSGADRFDTYHRDGGVGWTLTADVRAWPMAKYDDNSGTLADLTASYYSILWFYIETDGHLVMLYGQGEYAALADALTVEAPTTLPGRIDATGTAVGHIVFQKNTTPATAAVTNFPGVEDLSFYAYLPGRGGGQTLAGGTAASEDLTLLPTSHATRGQIYFGSARKTVFDDTNARFGLGTDSPGATMHVVSPENVTLLIETTTAAAHAAILGFKHDTATWEFKLQGDTEDMVLSWTDFPDSADVMIIEKGSSTNSNLNALYIDAVGNVGIGTDAPLSKIHAKSGAAYFIGLQIESTPVNSQALMYLSNDAQTWAPMVNSSDSFAIRDVTAGTVDPFSIEAGCPVNTLRLMSDGRVGIGGVPATSAKLDVASTTGAFLLPRMTTAQRNALTGANGMVIYNTTTERTEYIENGSWVYHASTPV